MYSWSYYAMCNFFLNVQNSLLTLLVKSKMSGRDIPRVLYYNFGHLLLLKYSSQTFDLYIK